MNRKLRSLVCLFLFSGFFAFSEETKAKSPWDFSIVTDFAYYPKSNYIPGGNHFAPATGFYSGIEFRLTGTAGYTIPIPFGKHPLVSGNTLRFYAALELSPVSLAPAIGINFSPIAFLDFSAGASIGAAWDLIGIQGLAKWNPLKAEYESLPFKSGRYNGWFSGTFMFDLAAVVPGEWNHLVTVNTYKVLYCGITSGGENGNPWLYQGSGEKANGWQYEASFILAYQMPIVLHVIGVQAELNGHFNGKKDFNELYHAMNPNFMRISVSPIMVFKFTEKDTLTLQFQFSARRSFTTTHTESKEELNLIYAGREWYFNRIALSYKHSF